VALKPPPVLVAIFSESAKRMVAPVLVASVTAGLAPVLRTLLAPVNSTAPPVPFCTRMPVPLSLMFPDRVSVPPVRPLMETDRLAVLVMLPA
jgi:hypothetical protein